MKLFILKSFCPLTILASKQFVLKSFRPQIISSSNHFVLKFCPLENRTKLWPEIQAYFLGRNNSSRNAISSSRCITPDRERLEEMQPLQAENNWDQDDEGSLGDVYILACPFFLENCIKLHWKLGQNSTACIFFMFGHHLTLPLGLQKN